MTQPVVFDRRSVLKLLAALTVAPSLGCVKLTTVADVDGTVVVVGAGAAGLACAAALVAAGHTVIVLEARDRIGGRTWTADVDGAAMDMGGAWIHGHQNNPTTVLADHFGLTHAEHVYGEYVTMDVGGTEPLTAADSRAANTRADAFWSATGGMGEDRSLLEAMISFFGPFAGLDRADRLAWSTVVWQIEDGGGPVARASVKGWNQWGGGYSGKEHIIEGGYVKLVDALATGLDIRLSEPVSRIEHGDASVTVHAASGPIVASHVVVTVPLGVLKAGSIVFEPSLPADKLASMDVLEMGNLEKVVLRYDEVWWEGIEGGGGALVGTEMRGMDEIYDWSEHAGVPTLAVLYYGGYARQAEEVLTDEELVQAALDGVAVLLGREVPTPTSTAITRWWSDPYAVGSYSFMAVGATPSDFDVLSEPVGERLLFAGEATHSTEFQNVHGAILTGLREAERLGADHTTLVGSSIENW